ncbi:extracellular solute-binding protein [Pimelobacter simplex]|uniref:Sulfate and thiosulfate binding protein CysP n=1 Tax=Nocardioides simplex TaxID=2045 RepID=A0A0A1DFQ3_NOCSI|nr:extracellular solute-binding protein [Pimelobacter simplex]AIY16116.1 Sulfate and thiosulfate binding protein CysP [Pimelobacter simplex]MCG8151156.1 extracellular solute-binding protein [Pimelobacter simplex]GEB12217.1 sulfate ABC transporter substrate-binding protein [Pimelobacter simplex]SFM98110.1 sulfate transport system substrate-binding protein [Pimelobacter simplex]
MKRSIKAVAVGLVGVLAFGACSSAAGGKDDGKTINIVGFAVPEAGNKAAATEFEKTDAGKDVTFSGSYGASGDQSRKVADTKGKDVDYVVFSLEPDMTRLVDAGLVADDWNAGPNKGIVSQSVAVIAVQKGNPLGIKDWSDLTRSDVKIVTPDPASSGSAKWNILALYTYAKSQGATEKEADEFLKKVFKNVTTWAASGREATESFKKGVGNVLLTYENEAILAKQNGENLDYILPDHSFLIENPGAVLKDSDPVAKDWLDFILSDKGQLAFVQKGFRPVGDVDISGVSVEGANDPANPFPTPGDLSTAADLGGWSAINAEWFGKDGAKLRFDKLYAEATKQ